MPIVPTDISLSHMSVSQLRTLFACYEHVFIMQWTGDRNPRGAKIDDQAIMLADACQVRTLDGRTKLGEYEKLPELSHPLNRTVFIGTNRSHVTNPNGGPCQEITGERELWLMAAPRPEGVVHKIRRRGLVAGNGS